MLFVYFVFIKVLSLVCVQMYVNVLVAVESEPKGRRGKGRKEKKGEERRRKEEEERKMSVIR